MLMKYLKPFDTSDSYIEPVKKEKLVPWQYFSARVGYIEISRNGRLEVWLCERALGWVVRCKWQRVVKAALFGVSQHLCV